MKIMRIRAILFVILAMTSSAVAIAQQQPARHFDSESWWSHIQVLADDQMEGRETGSGGLRKAEGYVVDQLTKAGLQPAGVDGFYQPVHLVSRQIVETGSAAALLRNGKAEPLTLGDDVILSSHSSATSPVEAELVFVGYGLRIPENHYDDLAGLDLKNKIAVYLLGSPADVPAPLSAHYQTISERWKALKEAGAIGTIAIPNPSSMDIPWSRISLNRLRSTMDLVGPEFDDTQGLQIALTCNPDRAEKLFAPSGHTFADLAALGKDRKPLPHFPLNISLRAHVKVTTASVESANIVAKLPGTDPSLKNEYVVLSAHVDHVGIGEPINGDRIYNGAMDDASGVAVVLDIAASWKQHAEQLRRSLLFVIVTAEEKGLLGSRYFAAHPTVAAQSMVADVNIDMFLPIVPLKVLKVQGLAESSLGDSARDAAQAFDIRVQPDPQPLRNAFIRSDQYSFIRRGIPAVKLDTGFDPGSPDQAVFQNWLTTRYHAPSDDLAQPVNKSSAALYEDIIRQLLISTANTDARPQWKSDSFFRRFAAAHN